MRKLSTQKEQMYLYKLKINGHCIRSEGIYSNFLILNYFFFLMNCSKLNKYFQHFFGPKILWLLFLTGRFSPLWLWWWRRTARCLKLVWDRAPRTQRSRSLLWSFYVLSPLWEGDPAIPPTPQGGSSRDPCSERGPVQREGGSLGSHPNGCGYWRGVLLDWWCQRC